MFLYYINYNRTKWFCELATAYDRWMSLNDISNDWLIHWTRWRRRRATATAVRGRARRRRRRCRRRRRRRSGRSRWSPASSPSSATAAVPVKLSAFCSTKRRPTPSNRCPFSLLLLLGRYFYRLFTIPFSFISFSIVFYPIFRIFSPFLAFSWFAHLFRSVSLEFHLVLLLPDFDQMFHSIFLLISFFGSNMYFICNFPRFVGYLIFFNDLLLSPYFYLFFFHSIFRF